LLEAAQAPTTAGAGISAWKNPTGWLLEKKLSRNFWVFFAVAFFFDFGFSVYFFLFNLYLLDFHFNERVIGLVGGALTLGTVAGTLPVGWLARRIGLFPPLACCMIAAPLLGAARAMAMWEWAQIGLAFLAGLAMCIWGVCFPPMVARLTTTENRAAAFSLIFSVSIGASALGGLMSGYLPLWLKMAGFSVQTSDIKRMILLGACVIALMGLVPLLHLQNPGHGREHPAANETAKPPWKLSPFLLRFLPSMALWTAVVASFATFANVYLSRDLHISLARIGLIFSLARVVQLCVGLLTPLVSRVLGLLNGIVATQVATAVALVCLAGTTSRTLAVALYLTFAAMQWMSSPGLYNLLMSRVPDAERSSAAAMTMLSNALMQSGAIAGAGILFARFGYPRVLVGIAGMALIAALLFKSLDMPGGRKSAAD
jgi:predicted MFS family arabinose efflux permease